MEITLIPIDLIDEPEQPHRLGMDTQALEELAASIKLEGLHQAISVWQPTEGRYEIIAGHRRYAACRMIGRTEIEAMIRTSGRAGAAVERFSENLQREQITPMEEAVAITNYMNDSGLVVADIARQLSKTEAWVRTRIMLMAIPDTLKAELHNGRIAIASAIALSRITDEQHRDYLTRYAIEGGASATIIKQWVDAWLVHVESGDVSPAPAPDWRPGDAVVIIQIPCALCGVPHDHRELAIIRVCHPCLDDIADVRESRRDSAAPG